MILFAIFGSALPRESFITSPINSPNRFLFPFLYASALSGNFEMACFTNSKSASESDSELIGSLQPFERDINMFYH